MSGNFRHSRSTTAVLILAPIMLLVLISAPLSAQWVQTGAPGSASIMCMVAKEGNLFAGTWGSGVYKSTDGGATWNPANNGMAESFYSGYIYALAVAPATDGNGTILFAGVEEGGIWRSEDDGDSWTWVYPGGVLGQHDISMFRLGVAGNNVVAGVRQEVFADGVYLSGDGGASWQRSNSGLTTAADSNIQCFTSIQSGGTNYLYAGTDGGGFLSTTEGASWSRFSGGMPADSVVDNEIALPDPNSNLKVALLASIRGHGVFRSTDNGSSWIEADDGFEWQGTSFGPTLYIRAFAASVNPGGTENNIFASGNASVFLSTNFGDRWWNTEWPYDSAQGPCAVLCVNGGTLFGASSTTIWKYSTSLDTGWTIQSAGTSDSLFAVKPVDNNVVWTVGSGGGIFKTTNGGGTWKSVGGGGFGTLELNAVEALDASTALVGTFSTGAGGGIYRTTDGGTSWGLVAHAAGGSIGGIQMKSALEGYAVGTPQAGKWLVLKTTDGGGSWNPLATAPQEDSLTGVGITALGAYFMRPRGVQLIGNTLLFGSVSGVVYRSTDLGVTWISSASNVNTFLTALHFNSSTTGLAGDGYTGTSRSTTNAGASWGSAGTVSSNPVTCLAGTGNEFWATTGDGIAYTNTMGGAWTFMTPGYWGIFGGLNAVSFSPISSPLNGWAVGDSGMILHYQRGAPASISASGRTSPAEFSLAQNYPNPFNPSTTIRYSIQRRSHVLLTVCNALGQQVATIIDGEVEAGDHAVRFDASRLASGVYFYRIQAGSFHQARKLLLVR